MLTSVVSFLVAPTEPPALKALGRVSSIPERHGADVLFNQPGVGLVGIQRKAFTDLLASVGDGRLSREVQQLRSVKIAVLIVEGRGRFTLDGWCMESYYTRWTKAAYRSLLRSVQGRGIFVEHSDSVVDTVGHIEEIQRWVEKDDHVSLDRRPNPKGNAWGRVSDEGWALHLLQSIDGLGPKVAKNIYDYFGGEVPITLTCTEKELTKVPGVGKAMARKIVRAFEGSVMEDRG